MSVERDYFKGFMGLFATGVTVVTTGAPGEPAYGLTVSSFTSVSLDPQLILICLDNNLSGLDRFRMGQKFAVNILAEDQQAVSNHFATPGTDRSEESGYYKSDAGQEAPFIRGCLGALECELVESYPAGDHTILLGKVLAVYQGKALNSKGPLLYYRGRYDSLSAEESPTAHTPQTA